MPRTCAAIVQAQNVLASGRVLSVKGLGGYHLACNAADSDAVALLRIRKGRGGKPFAVMAADLAAVQRIAFVDADEAKILATGAHPIVLLRKRPGAALAANVAPGNGYIGVMLPYTPLHELLFSDMGAGAPLDVLVMTSGNVSEEPINWRDEDALARLNTLADAFLLHDRPIYVPCDDSVVRIFEGHELPVRRARLCPTAGNPLWSWDTRRDIQPGAAGDGRRSEVHAVPAARTACRAEPAYRRHGQRRDV